MMHRNPVIHHTVLHLANAWIYLRHPINIALFRAVVGYFPNAALPRRYNEKMLWRKIFDRNPHFAVFSEKLATKSFVKAHCADLMQARTLWSGTDPLAIPSEAVQQPVVIKANHACDRNLFLDTPIDPADLPVKTIRAWLAKSHGRRTLEWAYQNAERRVFVEERLRAPDGSDPIDICVHAVDGKALFVEVIVANKTPNQRKGYFRTDGTRWPDIERKYVAGNKLSSLPSDFRIPDAYAEAITCTARLGLGIDYARFDFMVAGDTLYGSEITVYPGSGLTNDAAFAVYNANLASQWDLSDSWFARTSQRGLLRLYREALLPHLHEQTAVRKRIPSEVTTP